MITEISFLEPNLKTTKLNYNYDSDEEFNDSTDSEEVITENDTMIYAISNSSDVTYIQFYIYNEDNFYIHHDIMVVDTIATSLYYNKKIYTAGFSNTINTYNIFDFNPTAPTDTYEGHESVINKIKIYKNLFSCSDDKTMREYDIETGVTINIIRFDYEVKDFYFYEGRLITLSANNIYCGDLIYENSNEITCSQFFNNIMYFGDSEGNLKALDAKSMRQIKEVKICDSDINGISFYDDVIYAVSKNGLIKIHKDDSFVCKEFEKELTSITINSELKIGFVGNINSETIPIKLE